MGLAMSTPLLLTLKLRSLEPSKLGRYSSNSLELVLSAFAPTPCLQSLRFVAFFSERVPESATETFRYNKVMIRLFLEDGDIEMYRVPQVGLNLTHQYSLPASLFSEG